MSMDFYEELELADILNQMDECEHDNTFFVFGRDGEAELCEDCGAELEAEGPSDDSWYQRSLERAAGIGQPETSRYERVTAHGR